MENHLKWIDIENFKCFDHLRVEGLERVNLIGGDNNVGKTAFMEACLINILSVTPHYSEKTAILGRILMYRDRINRIYKVLEPQNDFLMDITENEVKKTFSSFKLSTNVLDYVFSKKELSVEGSEPLIFEEKSNNIVYLPSSEIRDSELSFYYDTVQLEDKEEFLNRSINSFDHRLDKFKFITSKPSCYLKSSGEYLNLSTFGEGVRRYITVLCALWASADGILFIDELENGIHYSKYEKLWEIILKTSQEANCQVFATTHSKECIEAFNRVQFREDLKDEAESSAYFAFARSAKGNGQIFATKRERDQLKYAIEHEMRYRGE